MPRDQLGKDTQPEAVRIRFSFPNARRICKLLGDFRSLMRRKICKKEEGETCMLIMEDIFIFHIYVFERLFTVMSLENM